MRFTGTIGPFNPNGYFLLSGENTYSILQKLYKGFMRIELLPDIRVVIYYFLVDLRKILRINVKIVAVFIQHPAIPLIRTD